MQCLWLTVADPKPEHNGQFVYSGGLIEAFAGEGAEIDVLGLAREESPRRDGQRENSVTWHLTPNRQPARWSVLRSPLPNLAHRCASPDMTARLEALLRRRWDAIVFDSISAGWGLKNILRHYAGRRPKLIYISHNHEESVRAALVRNQPDFVKRQALRLDGVKLARLDRALVRAADLMTTITPDDQDRYARRWRDKRIDVLTPGYRGRAVAQRRITGDMPRRAVIVGSFDWVAKRINLEEFVAVADPIFAARGAQLQIVGSGEPAFFERLRRKVSATEFTGTVESIDHYIDQARVAIVPEHVGGGFKLKVLEYVFNRLPIFALQGSVAGVPLRAGESIAIYPDQEALARGVLSAIDNLDGLNRQQDAAYSACCRAFDWSNRGRQLMAAIASL